MVNRHVQETVGRTTHEGMMDNNAIFLQRLCRSSDQVNDRNALGKASSQAIDSAQLAHTKCGHQTAQTFVGSRIAISGLDQFDVYCSVFPIVYFHRRITYIGSIEFVTATKPFKFGVFYNQVDSSIIDVSSYLQTHKKGKVFSRKVRLKSPMSRCAHQNELAFTFLKTLTCLAPSVYAFRCLIGQSIRDKLTPNTVLTPSWTSLSNLKCRGSHLLASTLCTLVLELTHTPRRRYQTIRATS